LDIQSGYQLKVSGNQQINISGAYPENKTLNYENAGWFLIPVLSECNSNIQELFAELTEDILIVKEVAGVRLYWPGVFQNLYQLEPGKSYIAGFVSPLSFTYPECAAMKSVYVEKKSGYSIIMNNMLPNPSSASLVIASSATQHLKKGDIISIQNTDNFALAEIEVENPDEAVGLQIFENDETTMAKDGFDQGDKMIIKVMRDGKAFDTKVVCNPHSDDLNFRKNGLIQVESLDFTNTVDVDADVSNMIFYPNPAKNILYFAWVNQQTPIKIYTAQGELVFDDQIDTPMLDVTFLSSGMYYVNIYQNQLPVVKKFIKQ